MANEALWSEWGKLTRFLHSTHLALTREAELWSTLELASPGTVELLGGHGGSRYSVSVEQHVATVQDHETLYASVLFASYALTEATAADQLGLDSRSMAGVEDWGSRLLKSVGKGWVNVFGELAGSVEVAVVRHAFAHGTRQIDAGAARRLSDAGSGWVAGPLPTLDYDSLQTYRSRLRSLLRQGITTKKVAN